MSWDKEIQELQHRNTLAEAMGGAEKVARQHAFGKLSIRERIAAVVDPGSFYEVGKLAGVGQYDADGNLISFMPANFVFGTAEIDRDYLRRRLYRPRRFGGRLYCRQTSAG